MKKVYPIKTEKIKEPGINTKYTWFLCFTVNNTYYYIGMLAKTALLGQSVVADIVLKAVHALG